MALFPGPNPSLFVVVRRCLIRRHTKFRYDHNTFDAEAEVEFSDRILPKTTALPNVLERRWLLFLSRPTGGKSHEA